MYTIQKHLHYNAWANGKVAALLANVDDKIFETEVKSSFTSVKKTILHIWDAEAIWLTRLQNGENKGWPSENFTGTKEDLLRGYVKASEDFISFIATKDRTYIESTVTYKNMKGVEFKSDVDEILSHVVNHGTFHRGQLVTMLRELGLTSFESQDLIAYTRQL